MIKIKQEQTRTNTIAIGFQGTPCFKEIGNIYLITSLFYVLVMAFIILPKKGLCYVSRVVTKTKSVAFQNKIQIRIIAEFFPMPSAFFDRQLICQQMRIHENSLRDEKVDDKNILR